MQGHACQNLNTQCSNLFRDVHHCVLINEKPKELKEIVPSHIIFYFPSIGG